MIDTNSINQAVIVAQDAAAQLKTNWPMICAASVIVARELRNFNIWCVNVAEFVMAHGGIGWLLRKLLWNPAADDVKRSQ